MKDYFLRMFRVLLLPFAKAKARLFWFGYDCGKVPQKAFEAAARAADGSASFPPQTLAKYQDFRMDMSSEPPPASEWQAMLVNRTNRDKLFHLGFVQSLYDLRHEAGMDGVTMVVDTETVTVLLPEDQREPYQQDLAKEIEANL
jgi:hypothetical protein